MKKGIQSFRVVKLENVFKLILEKIVQKSLVHALSYFMAKSEMPRSISISCLCFN